MPATPCRITVYHFLPPIDQREVRCSHFVCSSRYFFTLVVFFDLHLTDTPINSASPLLHIRFHRSASRGVLSNTVSYTSASTHTNITICICHVYACYRIVEHIQGGKDAPSMHLHTHIYLSLCTYTNYMHIKEEPPSADYLKEKRHC